MTAPTPAPSPVQTVENLVQDIEKALAAAQTALAFVDKFASFLPAQYRQPLEDLLNELTIVNNFLHKV
jgi:DNA-directed RNA polymerase subunit F